MDGRWRTFYETEKEKMYFLELQKYLLEERKIYVVIPSLNQIFEAFNLTSSTDIKVVIIGQDPNPHPNRATGVAFSLPADVLVEPSDYSINIIFEALEADPDVSFQRPLHGCLENWAKQGVLLLNSVLTYRADGPDKKNAHIDQGWEIFIRHVVQFLCSNYKNLVFILWGEKARYYEKLIGDDHLVMGGYHPAASRFRDSRVTRSDFISKNYFSKANVYLETHGKRPINWQF